MKTPKWVTNISDTRNQLSKAAQHISGPIILIKAGAISNLDINLKEI